MECQGQYELNFPHPSPVDIDGTPPVMFYIWVTKVFFPLRVLSELNTDYSSSYQHAALAQTRVPFEQRWRYRRQQYDGADKCTRLARSQEKPRAFLHFHV